MTDHTDNITTSNHPNEAKPIRILHITFGMKPRDIETWLINILHHVDHKQIRMDFITVQGQQHSSLDEEIISLGSTIHPLPSPAHKSEFLKAFRQLLEREQYDIVHAHPFDFCGPLMREAYRANIPVRITHGHIDKRIDTRGKSWFKSKHYAIMKNMISHYSTHGLAASTQIAESLFGVNWKQNNKYQLLFYGLDFERFKHTSMPATKKTLGLSDQSQIITHVSDFYFEQNHDFVLRLFKEIAKKNLKTYLLLIGQGPLEQAIKDQATALGISDRVIFTKDKEKTADLLQISDLFILPSLLPNLELPLIEAQAAGLPCIVSDTTPQESIINPDTVNILSLDDDIGLWLEKVNNCLETEHYNKEKALKIALKSGFNIKQNAQQLSDFYQTACN